MRVIYCDPALVSFAGHLGSHCSALTRGLTAAGAEVVVLGSAGLQGVTTRGRPIANPILSRGFCNAGGGT